MFKALSRDSVFSMSGVPSHADIRSLSVSSTTVVASTSVVTETIRPTITEVTTVSSPPETSLSTGQQQSEKSSSQTVQPATVQTNASQTSQTSQTQAIQLAISTSSQQTVLSPETTQLADISLSSTTIITPTWSRDDSVSSSLTAGQLSVSLPPMVGHSVTDSQTSSSELVVLSTSTSTALPTTTSTLTSTASSSAASLVLDAAFTTSISTPASLKTLVTPSFVQTISTPVSSHLSTMDVSPSPSASSIEGIISGSDSTSSQTTQRKSSSHVGAIVGGTIGGAVFVVLVLLAGILCLRHRRRRHDPINPKGLLRNSSDSLTTLRGLHDWHGQHENQAPFPRGPIFSPRGDTISPPPAPNSSGPTSNITNPHGVSHHPFSDTVHSPISAIINVLPPSRTASNYSQSSCEGGLRDLEKYDYHPTTPSSHYESIYYPDEGTFTPISEDDKLAPPGGPEDAPQYAQQPFDLEVPPKAMQEWPLPPHPTPWGDKF